MDYVPVALAGTALLFLLWRIRVQNRKIRELDNRWDSLGSMVLPDPSSPSKVIVVRAPITRCVSCPATFPNRNLDDLIQDGWRYSEVLGGWRCDSCIMEVSE